MGPLKYYSQEKIQKAIIRHSLHKEVVASYGGKGFGKRPDTLNYDSDILELAKQGATSFHISEEHWKNPRNLVPGMTKRQLDELRKQMREHGIQFKITKNRITKLENLPNSLQKLCVNDNQITKI